MPRTRSIKPGFFDDEDVAKVSMPARLLFIGLLTQADRDGRLEDRPTRLKTRLFAYDTIDLEPLLAELHGAHFIRRYAAGGRRLIQIRQFAKHQHPHIHEAKSTLPAPPSEALHQTSTVLASEMHDAGTVLASVEPVGYLVLGTGTESGGTGGRKPKRQGTFGSTEQAARFARWYLAYPRKENRGAAERAFRKLDPDDGMVDAWIAALQRQAVVGRFADPAYTPHPASWLNGRRWEDADHAAPASALANGVTAVSAVERARANGAAGLAQHRARLEGRA